jgi:hypothetical protein
MDKKSDYRRIQEDLTDLKNMREDVKEINEQLVEKCSDVRDRLEDFQSVPPTLYSRSDFRMIEDYQEFMEYDFRFPEKIERIRSDMQNELYRDAEDEDDIREIESLLKDIRRM